MFKKSKNKVLVDYASEDDISWHHQHTYKDPEEQEEEEEEEDKTVSPVSKEVKVKKVKSKKERRDKKMFSSQDDEHFLLTGVNPTNHRGSHKKSKEEEKEKNKSVTEKGFWDSVTMTMRQITPTRKLEKIEGWEPPQLVDPTETKTEEAVEAQSESRNVPVFFPQVRGLPVGLPSWTGMGLEEDLSCYANLSESRNSTAVRWTARAKGKLAGIRRRSRGNMSETWEGFK